MVPCQVRRRGDRGAGRRAGHRAGAADPPRPDHLPVPGWRARGPLAVARSGCARCRSAASWPACAPATSKRSGAGSLRGRGRPSTWSTPMPTATSATSWSGSCRGAGAATARLPLPGWPADVGWEAELVPFDEMPHLADPEIGFVASANNRPAADGDAPYLGTDWMDGYRMARIVEELARRHDWDVAGCARPAAGRDQRTLAAGARHGAGAAGHRRGRPDGGRHPARLGRCR